MNGAGLPVPAAGARDARRWVTPEPLNVAPQLVGLPLATPWRRSLAMGVDLLVVALLSGVASIWLVAGLGLVVLQLRSGRAAVVRWRAALGWGLAALLLALALQEVAQQWQARADAPATRAEAPASKADVDAEAVAADGAASAVLAIAAALGASVPQTAADALSSPPAPAASAASAAEAAEAAARAAAERIAQLEAELAEARRPRPFSPREELERVLDALGASFGWGIVYFSLLPAWWGGQTLGKKLFGLRVLELTGQPMTVMRCLKRYGGYAAGMATGGLGFAQVLWDQNRQGLQDKAAHTVVVDLRRPPLTPAAGSAPT